MRAKTQNESGTHLYLNDVRFDNGSHFNATSNKSTQLFGRRKEDCANGLEPAAKRAKRDPITQRPSDSIITKPLRSTPGAEENNATPSPEGPETLGQIQEIEPKANATLEGLRSKKRLKGSQKIRLSNGHDEEKFAEDILVDGLCCLSPSDMWQCLYGSEIIDPRSLTVRNLFTKADFSKLRKRVLEPLPQLDSESEKVLSHLANAKELEEMVLRACEIPKNFPKAPRWLRNWLLGFIPHLQDLCEDHHLEKYNSEQWWADHVWVRLVDAALQTIPHLTLQRYVCQLDFLSLSDLFAEGRQSIKQALFGGG